MNSSFQSDRYSDITLDSSDGLYERYTAKDNMGRELVIVVLPQHRASNPMLVSQFNLHTEVLGSIAGAHFVRLLEYLPADGENSPAMVIENMPHNLAELAGKDTLHPDAVVEILKHVLAAIRQLHGAGYLHLGISTAAIGVNRSCSEVRMLDAGGCYQIDNEDESINVENSKYGAPELYGASATTKDQTVDPGPYSDIYSVGILGYELLVGSKNFSSVFRQVINEESAEVQSKKWINWHRNDESAPLAHELNKKVSEALSSAISRMMEKDPTKRLQTVDESLQALNINTTAGEAEQIHLEEPKSKPLWLYVLAPLSIVVSAVFLYLVVFKDSSDHDVDPAVVQTVSNEEFLTLAERNKVLRTQIDVLKFEANENFKAGMDQLELARSASDEGVEVQFRHLQNSTVAIQSFFDQKASAKYELIRDEMEKLMIQAEQLGTMNMDFSVEESPELVLADPVLTTSTLVKLEDRTNDILLALKKNSRSVAIGSTQIQIDAAVEDCRRYAQGCSLDWYADELRREIILTPFLMDTKETTVSEFAEYVEKLTVVTEAERRGFSSRVVGSQDFAVAKVEGLNWKGAYEGNNQILPVIHVTRADATGYCKSIGKRLPTEDEWEFSARGPELNVFPWGMEWDKTRAYWANTEAKSVLPGGSFAPSETGLYDLAGSVSEWTSSNAPQSGYGYVKGGSRFDTNVANMRLSVRRTEPLDYSGEDVGYRCAKDLDEWPEVQSE